MTRIRDLSPKLTGLEIAERELYIPPLFQEQSGQMVGGLQVGGDSLKRGYGNKVFGSSNQGIWLGAANFADAPFQVDMDGNLTASSAILGGYSKISIFKQTSIPTSLAIGDLWFDTDDNNKVYRAAVVGATTIAGGQWEAIDDQRAADAVTKAGANQAVSGQVIVGGSVNGKIFVKNSAGATKITLDQDGILIEDGKMVIKNDSGVTSIDSKGIVSGANFGLSAATVNSLNQSGFSNNTDTDITGATLTFTLDRAANMLFMAAVTAFLIESAGNTGNAYVTFFVDGVEVSTPYRMQWFSGATKGTTGANHFLKIPLASGTHTVKLVGHLNFLAGTPDFNIYAFNLSYTKLGT